MAYGNNPNGNEDGQEAETGGDVLDFPTDPRVQADDNPERDRETGSLPSLPPDDVQRLEDETGGSLDMRSEDEKLRDDNPLPETPTAQGDSPNVGDNEGTKITSPDDGDDVSRSGDTETKDALEDQAATPDDKREAAVEGERREVSDGAIVRDADGNVVATVKEGEGVVMEEGWRLDDQ